MGQKRYKTMGYVALADPQTHRPMLFKGRFWKLGCANACKYSDLAHAAAKLTWWGWRYGILAAMMHPDRLLALASPKAIPLVPHEECGEQKQQLTWRNRAVGHQTSVYRSPEWTQQELGMAAMGLKKTPWRAALYAKAGVRGKENWDYLHRCLMDCGAAHARREHWPEFVLREDATVRPYLSELAALVLHAQGDLRHVTLATPSFGEIYLDVNAMTWEVVLRDKYELLQDRFECWLRRANTVITAWMNGGDEVTRIQARMAGRGGR